MQHPDIIDVNIRMKASKIHQVSTKIRNDVRDLRIERIGATKATALLIEYEIIPIISYGTEDWLRISKKQRWKAS